MLWEAPKLFLIFQPWWVALEMFRGLLVLNLEKPSFKSVVFFKEYFAYFALPKYFGC